MAKGYWIGRVDVANDEGYKPYAAANPAIFKKFGGRFIVKGGKAETLLGPARGENVVIEFDDYAKAKACFESAEYQAAAEYLNRSCSVVEFVIVEGTGQ